MILKILFILSNIFAALSIHSFLIIEPGDRFSELTLAIIPPTLF